MLGTTELLIIGAVLILLFGGPAVVKWAKSLGQAKRVYQEESQKPIEKNNTKVIDAR